jgi:arylsulfatase A-like enzyme
MLGDADYATGYFGKWHLGDEPFAQRGFQHWASIEDGYDDHFSPGRDPARLSDYHQFLVARGYRPEGRTFSRDFCSGLPVEHTKAWFAAEGSARFILSQRRQPWVCFVSFLEPHRPYNSVWNDRHAPEDAPVPPSYDAPHTGGEPQFHELCRESARRQGYNLNDRAELQRLNRNYAGCCSLVDHAVGRILTALESSGQAGNTIVVFTSDHGEMMGAHRLLHKSVFYEESLRVPLLIRVPFRHSRSFRVERPVSNVSLAATLLDLMGRKAPDRLHGESLLPLLDGKRLREEHVFSEWHREESGPNGRAVISADGWKMAIYDQDSCLLFDRNRDPGELHNLYADPGPADVRRRLRAELDRWQKRTGDRLPLEGKEVQDS